MNFLLEQILYFIFNLFTNPVTFIKKINNIENLPFGREVYKIEIIGDKIFKYYRNKHFYYKNLNYYNILKDHDFIPRNLYSEDANYLIVQQYRGKLLKQSELDNIIKLKMIKLLDKLEKNCIIVEDIKPLFFNNNVINNLTLQNEEIYLIDYGDIKFSGQIEANIFYTRLKKYYNLN